MDLASYAYQLAEDTGWSDHSILHILITVIEEHDLTGAAMQALDEQHELETGGMERSD